MSVYETAIVTWIIVTRLEKSYYLHDNPGCCMLQPYLHAVPPAIRKDVWEVTIKKVAVNNANQNNNTPYWLE
jgi:hypothetical protein